MAARKIDGGEACPKCGRVMQRMAHPLAWTPPVGAKQFYVYWDRCDYCKGRTQHYKAALRYVEQERDKFEPLFKEYRETLEREGVVPLRAPEREGKLPWED